MITVVGVRFKKAGKIYYFDPDGLDIQRGDDVVVETARGIEFGKAVLGLREVDESEIVTPLKKVMRIATEEDQAIQRENQEKAKEAHIACQAKIIEHELEMKLVEVEYTFDCNKVIFYFTADGRIDFRELVKDLASVFRTRIELRQIGVRDEAKIVNGIGPCGVGLCCANWLGDFAPVSIKMAKDQNLSLNPTKISGICGRLMCCLKYEHDTYQEIRRELPNRGERIKTPDGMGVVLDSVILTESVKVRHILNEQPDGRLELSEDIVTYKKNQLGDNPEYVKPAEEEPFDDMRFDGLDDHLKPNQPNRRDGAGSGAGAGDRRDRSKGGADKSGEREGRPPQKAKADRPEKTERTERPEQARRNPPAKKSEPRQVAPGSIEPDKVSEGPKGDAETEGTGEEGQKPRRRRPRRRKKK
ncbi:Cell fate regulator YaaT, PSP1 superfamily (controls sporulation, competence, biofilm development) [Acidaminobacter hydrogenoformans DSM 2784]|uniref:Cell fate regulator YaaT, PSP1 superfamily (Controls sporulation, competence, biofilm development) n=1 Tax=Acidaminobacter hydrogenoformans DSM 2784 TaxID=1120920 RepID=A0A1G5RZD9_9FIRM|nr:Cell fate regulator YaaT, PSP1 superfamily (controls sporulation, competence, biofilm development) [Acidaminobacter hydrogenoformans DSM 2784]